MSNRLAYLIAGILLTAVFFMAVFSLKDDSATMDELAHLPAGYSYLTQQDMRLNPEHPPIIKDLAAVPLLFIKEIKFPADIKEWQEDVNGQWGFGRNFLYRQGNPADQMIFWGRIPMVLVLLLLGFYIFWWTRELFGNRASLLALFLFSFSPAFLAHGRLVTTDVAAAAGIFIATYYFLKSLRRPTFRNILLAGLFFGLAELFKFSVILLVPFFFLMALVFWILNPNKLKEVLRVLIFAFLAGLILIGLIYQFHVWNYPPERQVRDAQVYLAPQPDFIKQPILWSAQKPILRGYAQYLTGLIMVFQRAAGGNTSYFLGEVSNLGWKTYFPIVYLIKEPIPFHLFTLIALLYAAWLIKRPFWQRPLLRLRHWAKNHFAEFSMLAFLAIYWAATLKSNLNLGIRHLLPIFPFTMVLVAGAVTFGLKGPFLKAKYLVLAALLLWQVGSVFMIYPHFLAYFNELAGGADKGYLYVVDSNLDWGQDLKRLKKWTDQNLPAGKQIYVDYFGGGDPKYYLKEKYAPWWGQRSPKEFPKGNYLAVSATFLQGGRGRAAQGFNQPTGYYLWLNEYRPIAKIGYSIFVYYID
jgi:4-amino-4-deoxy-L-arabinose transferase-like glycosyltransferase